jgi:membrane fusion protein (multidrug efflux system)
MSNHDHAIAAPRRMRAHRGGMLALIGVVVAGGLAAYGIWQRNDTVTSLKQEADDAAIPRVQLVSPKPAPPRRTLTLPGNIEAWYQAPIYAQVTGYVAHWFKDYGAQVKAGDVLASIDTPSLDAQFAAAKAQLMVAQARYKLAVITAKRWAALAGTQAVAQQDVDVKQADAVEQQAEVTAAEQTVAQYQAMETFKNLVAPFDGVVTARRTNVGDYVNASGGDSTARTNPSTALFSVADIHKLRIFVSVPQNYMDALKPGLTATLTLPQKPEDPIPAQYLTTANAVNTPTRTIVTEFSVDNPKGDLWGGTYVDVHFNFPSDPNILILPEQALLFRAQGMQAAVVDDQNKVHLQNVSLGRNLDTDVEIVSGLKATDKVIANPSLGLLEGQQVKVVQPVQGYQAESSNQAAAPPQPVPPPTPAEPGATAAAPVPGTGAAAPPSQSKPATGTSP